jgi:predicted NAD/FAD-binding protein
MPKDHNVWSAWNYITTSPEPGKSPDTVCLTYWMNLLQHIPTDTFGDVLVTLNPLSWPKDDTIQGVWKYRHPLYTSEAVRSQSLLPRIQNTRGISYCGAWTKYGFHEDGFSSGLKVAVDHLGAALPFEFTDSTFSRGRRPQLTLNDHAVRVLILAIHIAILSFTLAAEKILGRPSTKKKI